MRPEAFEELREFTPSYQYLFPSKPKDDFQTVLIAELKESLVLSMLVMPPYRRPDQRMDIDFIWGDLKLTFLLAQHMTYMDTPGRDYKVGDCVKEQIEENRYTLQSFVREIESKFENSAVGKEDILLHFLNLQAGIYRWVEKYKLERDWLVNYAYYFLFQFMRLPETPVKDIPIWPRRYYSPTLYRPFKFEMAGWLASEEGETSKEYKSKVLKECEKLLDEYLIEATLFLSLGHKTKSRKPLSFEAIEWLVRRVFCGWNSERILEHYLPEISAGRTGSELAVKSFKHTKKRIQNEMRNLRKYNLPHS